MFDEKKGIVITDIKRKKLDKLGDIAYFTRLFRNYPLIILKMFEEKKGIRIINIIKEKQIR